MEKGKKIKTAALVAVLIMIILHLFDIPVSAVGLSSESPAYTRFTYQFFHAGWLHLVVNMWALLTVVFYYRTNWLMIFVSYLISATVPASDIPAIGLSGMLFALYGFVSIQSSNKRLFHLWVAAFIAAGFFINGIGSFIHLHCYILSLLSLYLYECYIRHIDRE